MHNYQCSSLYLQVQVGYEQPRTYTLTPSRKALGKHVARANKLAVARDCIRDPAQRNFVVRVLGHQLLCELPSLCSDKVASILRASDLSKLSSFTWDALLSEMSEHAPTLLGLLKICTVKRNKSHSYNTRRSAVMSLCVALLCKLQNKSMNLVQKLISLILYTGHCSKEGTVHTSFMWC